MAKRLSLVVYAKQSNDRLNEEQFIAALNIYYQEESDKLALLHKLFQLAYKKDSDFFTLNEAKILLSREMISKKSKHNKVFNKKN